MRKAHSQKKARTWLDAHGVTYAFHDYKTQSIAPDTLRAWVAALGWQTVLNRAGTTFRKLDDGQKADLDAERAIALMLAQPSMIKRPVLEIDGRLIVGFDPSVYASTFA